MPGFLQAYGTESRLNTMCALSLPPLTLGQAKPNPIMRTARVLDNEHKLLYIHHLVLCPGCHDLHSPATKAVGGNPGSRPLWDWNGSETCPTFSPSYLTWWGGDGTQAGASYRCHSYIIEGMWQFLSDCTHELVNQHVPMVPLPDWLCN